MVMGCSSISDLRSGDDEVFVVSVCVTLSWTGSVGGGVVGGEEERAVVEVVLSVPSVCTFMVV